MGAVVVLGRLPAVLRVGAVARCRRLVTADDVDVFAQLTGDHNPLHFDDDFCRRTRFGKRIVHGMLYATMFNTIIAESLPGAVHMSQSFAFKHPVYVGDELVARLEVASIRPRSRLVTVVEDCVDSRGNTVLTGTAELLTPRHFLERPAARA